MTMMVQMMTITIVRQPEKDMSRTEPPDGCSKKQGAVLTSRKS